MARMAVILDAIRSYLRWSLRQFYLLIFHPSQFGREVEPFPDSRWSYQDRIRYLLKLLPCTLIGAALGNLMAGMIIESARIDFDRTESWYGVAGGVAGGVAVGVAGDVVF